MYKLLWATQGKKDYDNAKRLRWYIVKMAEILAVLRRAPFEPTPEHHFERLTGNLKGRCSRQINYHNLPDGVNVVPLAALTA